jgi:HSP20 family protein
MGHQAMPRPARKLDGMSIQLGRTRAYAHLLHHIVDGSYERAFAPSTSGSAADGGGTGFQSLPVNVWETEEAYLATLMAPGLDEQTINVTVHEDKLVIEGTLAFEAPAAATPVWQEFYQGPSKFRRSLRLGAAVDSARVEALYRNGQLMITMAKAENAKPRQIQVQGIAIEAKPE